jgi:hypothetical protein
MKLTLHSISPQYESLSDISFRQSKISVDIRRIKSPAQYDKTRNNGFSALRNIQMGTNKSKYLRSIHIEENGQCWFDVDFNKPMSLMIICENNYGDKSMDMKELTNIIAITNTYFSPKTCDIDDY